MDLVTISKAICLKMGFSLIEECDLEYETKYYDANIGDSISVL